MNATGDETAALQAFVEKAAVREVLENYFHGLDARDEESLTACFTADASATHHKGSDSEFTLNGGAAIARYFSAGSSAPSPRPTTRSATR